MDDDSGFRTRRYVGCIITNGILHLFENQDDLRAHLDSLGRDWGRAAWLHGVEFHTETRGPQPLSETLEGIEYEKEAVGG